MNPMIFFSYSLYIGLSCILVKMGTTIKYENIDVQHPWLFINVFAHQYIIDPIYTFVIVYFLNPPIHQVYGMFIVALTPSTVAASVTTYTVNGDVPLSLAMSIGSLIQSIALTPTIFSGMIKLYSLVSTRAKHNKIVLPYFRMFILMTYIITLIGIGFTIRRKMRESVVNKLSTLLQRCSIVFVLAAFACFFASSFFLKAMNPSNPLSYFGSIFIITYGSLLLAYFPTYIMKDIPKKDAVILVITRRSPGISLAIATLSFHNTKYYGNVVGYILVFSMIRDYIFMPFLLVLRKKRLGHYFFSNQKTDNNQAIHESNVSNA